MIMYITKDSNTIDVKLDGKLVGSINKIYNNDQYGYQYCPKSSKFTDTVYDTIDEVKESLG